MRIGIIGNYGHNNNGDEAILSGLIHQLTTDGNMKKDKIVVFSNNPKNTQSRHGVQAVPLLHKRGGILSSGLTTVRESRRIMKGLDLIIIGGGGLLMDMYKRDAPLYSVLGLTGKASGCRIAIHGVGAGPIDTKVGKFFIKRLLQAASTVAVRDEKSKQLLERIGVKKDVRVIYDPAFSVPRSSPRTHTDRIQKVGVTAVPYFSSQYWPETDLARYEAYISGVAHALDQLIAEKKVQVTFFSTKFPEDVQVTKDIASHMTARDCVQINENNLLPEEIVALASEQDVIIGTRLHSLILAVNAGTPVIGIEYHPKVKDFMATIDNEQFSVPIQDVDSEANGIYSAFLQMEQDWHRHQKSITKWSNKLKEEAAAGIKLLQLPTKSRN